MENYRFIRRCSTSCSTTERPNHDSWLVAFEPSPRRLSHMDIEVGALCLWLVAISIFGAAAMFILTATLSRIKTAPWW
jgi:hypothetical protein